MKRSFSRTLHYLFASIGILGSFIIIGSTWLYYQSTVPASIGKQLSAEASALASAPLLREFSAGKSIEDCRQLLLPLARAQDSEIWITDIRCNVLCSTAESFSSGEILPHIPDFDPEKMTENHYSVSDLGGTFSGKQLITAAAIRSGTETRGYLLLFYPMSLVQKQIQHKLLPVYQTFFLVYLIFLLLLLRFTQSLIPPLKEIIRGTTELATGNLKYRIEEKPDSRLGPLAENINSLAEHLDLQSEYQHNYLSNISHDFRSPLTSIRGYVEAIRDGVIPYESREKYCDIILYETDRLEKLTRGIMVLNRLDQDKEVLQPTDFPINRELRLVAAAYEGQCESKHLRMLLNLHEDPLIVHGDQKRIQQVLYNLVDNAIKFSPPSGIITLESYTRNGLISVSVHNQGPVIPSEDMAKIWNRFYKIDHSRGKDQTGIGLGLSIVKEIVSAHGQTIRCTSTEEDGTTFVFTLETGKTP